MRVRNLLFCWAFAIVLAQAETHPLTLQQTLELAGQQNPDVTLARLDQQHAEEGVRVASDPFHPKVILGSGAAYTYGYPNTIEGSAPAIFQLTTQDSLFNQPKRLQLAAAHELARGAGYAAQGKTDDVAYQAADLFLTASQMEHAGDIISGQLPSLRKVIETMSSAVSEGAELPLQLKQAKLNLQSSEVQLSSAQSDKDYYETMLAVAVGFPATDRVKPVDSDLPVGLNPASETEAIDDALRTNKQLRQLQANVIAKQLELRSYKAARLPQVDLVAQYALFAKYTYDQYFPSTNFQRNNFQIGAAISLPLLVGAARGGYMAQSTIDLQKLRIQGDQLRNRIITDTRRSYDLWKKAETLRDLARAKLDFARENLTVKLAQNAEGRTPLRELEQARLDESTLWMQLYDAEAQTTRAKLAVMRQTGTLMAAVQAQRSGIGAGKP